MLHFDEAEFETRREKMLAAMRARRLDAMFLFAQESMYWLTGYDTFGYCFFQCLVVTAKGDMALLTRSADLRQAQLTSNIPDIHVWRDRADAAPTRNLRDLAQEMGLLGATIGVEYDTHGMTAANGRALDREMKTFASLVDASDLVSELRVVKSPAEIAYIRRAGELTDDAYEAALPLIEDGADEAAILAAMQGAILAGDGDYPANEFIIGSGPQALLCRYYTGRRRLSAPDQLTLEWAGACRHYHVAAMRTVVVGDPRDDHAEKFEAAAAALEAVEQAMRPGRTFGDVFDAHASVLDGQGLARARLAACGYSLGARFSPSWMERQMFVTGSERAIEQGMSLFAHMIVMDSETGTAMTLGRTYLTTTADPEPLSRLPIRMDIR